MLKILVLNSGSSSIKYSLFRMDDCSTLAAGSLERIGEPQARLRHRGYSDSGEATAFEQQRPVSDHRQGLTWIAELLDRSDTLPGARELDAIGHRVVHGGEQFAAPVLITDQVMDGIRRSVPLAPLHNPANLTGIEVAREFAPEIPQVAVFDTAFHQTLPARAFMYALPQDLYSEFALRRYGFHGTSHQFLAKQTAQTLGRPLDSLDLITLHLGNGASAAAIRGGRSVDTSMGLTPLEGLVMGTRCGDLDPAVPFYLSRLTGRSPDAIETMLNEASGLKGLCGENDMRAVLNLADSGDPRAALAIEVFCYRVRKYIGAYLAVLGRLDALVFAGGIGENSARIRSGCCQRLQGLGIRLDEEKNHIQAQHAREIQHPESAIKVLVVPTHEELEIARQTLVVVSELPAEPGR